MNQKGKLVIQTIFLWLIIIGVTIFYFLYYKVLLEYLDLFVSLIPMITFFIVGTLILNRNTKRISKTKKTEDYNYQIELNWMISLKHDLLTYFLPVLILALPLFLGKKPDLEDLLAAIIVFLSLTYLKLIYWHRL